MDPLGSLNRLFAEGLLVLGTSYSQHHVRSFIYSIKIEVRGAELVQGGEECWPGSEITASLAPLSGQSGSLPASSLSFA